jgi:hypothetical protein
MNAISTAPARPRQVAAQFHRLQRAMAGLLLGMASAGCGQGPIKVEANRPILAPPPTTEPREDWDRAFQRTDGWTGGDVAQAVDLGNQRTLWIWGDSWVGPVRDGKHAVGSRLVNNSLAIHDTMIGGAAPPADAIEFFWGPANEKSEPTAWLRPDASRVTPRLPQNGTDDPAWYWLVNGIVLPDAQANPRLVLFAWHIARTKGDGVWNFCTAGNALTVVDNSNEPVDEWHLAQHDIPHALGDVVREATPPSKPISWGSALLLVPRVTEPEEHLAPWLYIYGTRGGGLNTELLLARVPANRVENFSQWEFRTAEEWSSRLDDAVSRADGLVSEFSVTPIELAGKSRYVMIQSQPLFGKQILARTADAPDAHWSEGHPVYQVTSIDADRDYFTYAAKAHPHLSAGSKLLVSYMINSHNFAKMVNDANVYRPRFVEVDLSALTGK